MYSDSAHSTLPRMPACVFFHQLVKNAKHACKFACARESPRSNLEVVMFLLNVGAIYLILAGDIIKTRVLRETTLLLTIICMRCCWITWHRDNLVPQIFLLLIFLCHVTQVHNITVIIYVWRPQHVSDCK